MDITVTVRARDWGESVEIDLEENAVAERRSEFVIRRLAADAADKAIAALRKKKS